MDGVAFASPRSSGRAAIPRRRSAGGRHPPLSSAAGRLCFEAMTGAILPRGCDCVVPVERIVVDDALNCRADLTIEPV